MNLQWPFATRLNQLQSSAIREILKVTAQPGVISFAGGLPAPELFPIEQLAEACQRVLGDEAEAAASLQYSPTEGYPPLKQAIIQRSLARGLHLSEEELLITHGSQQGLDLVARAFLDPGDGVAVDNPGYLGAIQTFQASEARLFPLEIDRDGTVPESLEEVLRHHRVKLIYLTPNFHNPLGVTMSLERRRRIVELAERAGALIVEDDPYGELRYAGDELPSLRSFSSRFVIGLGSFSKILVPGFRLGWTAAHPEIIEKLVLLKQATDLHTNSFAQRVTAACLESGFLDGHIRTLREVYSERREIMLDALQEHLSGFATWSASDGGLFIWVELNGMDAQELLHRAVEYKVAFVPGLPFYVANPQLNTLRLNFSNMPPERLRSGIAALRQAIESMRS